MKKDTKENFEYKEKRLEDLIKEMGEIIGRNIPIDTGFALLIFEWKEKGGLFYVSNAEREGIITMMEEFIKIDKSQP